MSDRIVLTINMGGTYIRPNVMASHVAAAARWRAQYVQLTAPWGETRHIWSMKARLHKALPGFMGRVCFVDGDAIVRHDCPDPFRIVPEDTFGACRGHQLDECDTSNTASWWALFRDTYKADQEYNPDHYLNTGFMVYTPALHHRYWELWPLMHFVFGGDGPMVEQTALNFALSVLGAKVMILPDGFNKLGPEAWEPGPMRHYVQHLARGPWSEGRDRDLAIEGIDWTAEAPEEAAVGA